jgi:hypothetical protein
VKVAGFWCVFAQGAMILAYMVGISSVRFFYFAAVAFGLQSVFVLLGALFANGFSWKLFFIAAICFAIGISPLPLMKVDYAAGPGWLFRGIARPAGERSRTVDNVQPQKPVDHLAAAAQIIFSKETQGSLAEARRHLLSVPQPAAEYKSAQALLQVVESRLGNDKVGKDVRADEKAPIEIIASEQTQHGLRVTLQNNGSKSVRNIRYHVSYFRASDGQRLEPDKESLILGDIPPNQARIFELSDKNIIKGFIYGSFAVVNWEVGSDMRKLIQTTTR